MTTTVVVSNVSSSDGKGMQLEVTNPGETTPTISILKSGQVIQLFLTPGGTVGLSEVDVLPPAPPLPAPPDTLQSLSLAMSDLANRLVNLAATSAQPPTS